MRSLNATYTNYKSRLASNFTLDANFIYLYKPLIGSRATFMYQLLYNEAKNMMTVDYTSIKRIMNLTGYTTEELTKYIDRLELIGLLKSFQKKVDEDKVTFVIEKPLTVNQFKRYDNLMEILRIKVGEETVEMNMSQLNKSTWIEEEDEYEEVTGEFSIELEKLEFSNNFNFEPIKEMLSLTDTDVSFWNDEIEKEVLQAIIIEDLSNLEVVKIIKDSFDSQGEFSIINFKSNSKSVAPLEFKERLEERIIDSWEAKLKLLESTNPRQFFELRFEREATADEKKLIKSMIKTSKMPFEFVNLILDFVALKNKGVFVIKYVEKIIKTVLEKELETIEQLKTWLAAGNKKIEKKDVSQAIENYIEKNKVEEKGDDFEKIEF